MVKVDPKKLGHSLSAERSNSSSKMGSLRTKSTVRRLQMYRGKVKFDKDGKLIKGSVLSKADQPIGNMQRIAPNRKWFGNTRVMGSTELEKYRQEMRTQLNDPYAFVMHKKNLPLGLLQEPTKTSKARLLDVESFHETFSAGRRQKRPKLAVVDVSSLANAAGEQEQSYTSSSDRNIRLEEDFKEQAREDIFAKGQSKRIWGELYKVIDSSDVVVEVLDARDPEGTRCPRIEKYIKNEKQHKHLVLVLNKCDLIPTWATARWVRVLSREFPTVAMHASITNPFGKGALISLLRQFGKLHSDRQSISVGFIGYPNVGKSSIINTLLAKRVCSVAPVPGETKVWQYVTLFKKIYLIDCPGVVYSNDDSETDIVLKGVVRVERLENADEHLPMVLERVKPEYIAKAYGVAGWTDAQDFLQKFCDTTGKLLKGGEADLVNSARKILQDWQRGRLPWFVAPPELSAEEVAELALKREEADRKTQEAPTAAPTAAGLSTVVPSVKQKFKDIAVSNEFAAEGHRDPRFVGQGTDTAETGSIFSDDEGNDDNDDDNDDDNGDNGDGDGDGEGEEDSKRAVRGGGRGTAARGHGASPDDPPMDVFSDEDDSEENGRDTHRRGMPLASRAPPVFEAPDADAVDSEEDADEEDRGKDGGKSGGDTAGRKRGSRMPADSGKSNAERMSRSKGRTSLGDRLKARAGSALQKPPRSRGRRRA